MNTELKAILDEIFAGMKLAEDGVSKNYIALVSDAVSFISALPSVMANLGSLEQEIQSLKGSAQESDLLAYLEKQFSAHLQGAKAQGVLSTATKVVQDAISMVQDGVALEQLLKS